MDFIINNLLIIIIILVALFIFGIFFRALKFVVFIGIIILVLGFFGFLGDGFNEKAKDGFNNFSTYSQEKIIPLVKENLETADFAYNKETKEYVIGTGKFSIKGTQGVNKANFIVNGQSTEFDATFLSDYINKEIQSSVETTK
jgi:cell division protein FtsW (lipid II flippase)